MPCGALCDLRTTWFVISLHLTAVNQAQSTKITSKEPKILVSTWACVLRKKHPPTHYNVSKRNKFKNLMTEQVIYQVTGTQTTMKMIKERECI